MHWISWKKSVAAYWRLVAPIRATYVACLALSAVSAVAAAQAPLLMLAWVQTMTQLRKGEEGEEQQTGASFPAAWVACSAAAAAAGALRGYAFTLINHRLHAEATSRFVRAVLARRQHPSGVARLASDPNAVTKAYREGLWALTHTFTLGVQFVLRSVASAASVMLVLLSSEGLDPKSIAALAAISAAQLTLSKLFLGRYSAAQGRTEKAKDARDAAFSHAAGQLPVVRALDASDLFERMHRDRSAAYGDAMRSEAALYGGWVLLCSALPCAAEASLLMLLLFTKEHGDPMRALLIYRAINDALDGVTGMVKNVVRGAATASEALELLEALEKEEEPAVQGEISADVERGEVRLEDVRYSYGGDRNKNDNALSPTLASFRAKPGDVVGVTGPSGSGKSTLVKLIAGVLTPTSGRCLVGGRVALVSQDALLLEGLTLRQNLLLGTHDQSDEVEDTLEVLGLSKFADESTLDAPWVNQAASGGERQRLSIAKALLGAHAQAQAYDVLLLDEPTSALDAVSVDKVIRLLSQTIGLRDAAITVIIVTHDDASTLRGKKLAGIGSRDNKMKMRWVVS